jgi:RNA polymerase sigma factor (sigma-70 family)
MPDIRVSGTVPRVVPARATSSQTPQDQKDVAELVRAARAGEEAAWTGLVRRFDLRLRSAARSYRLSPADVDDVVQTTWVQLFRHIDAVRDPAAVAGWLLTTAHRESLRRISASNREVPTDALDLPQQPHNDGPEAHVLDAEERAILRGALATLPDRHRRLMTVLVAAPGISYRELSAALAIPTGSIGPIRARCLRRLARNDRLKAHRAGAID